MTSPNQPSIVQPSLEQPKNRNPWKVFGITVICLAAIVLGIWLIKSYLFPTEFKPVALSSKETRQLNDKLSFLNLPTVTDSKQSTPAKPLEPEPYSERNAKREVSFSEREINALIAHNTDMADKLAIDLSSNLASAKLLMPLDPEFPVMGGKTLSLHAGVEFGFRNGRPVVKLKGVSAWGVPVPNAWMGNLKNVDLVGEFGGEGFWKGFADGVEFIEVRDGKLLVKLKE